MLTLTARQLAHMVAHAQAGKPDEVCGLIAGRDGRARAIYRVPNVAEQPGVTYRMDPAVQVRCFDHMDRRGWDLLGIYHSHPRGPETPSETDIAQSYYPGALHVVVSLEGVNPTVRAFRIRDGAFEETIFAAVESA